MQAIECEGHQLPNSEKQELDGTFRKNETTESGVFSNSDADNSKGSVSDAGNSDKKDGPDCSSGLDKDIEACNISTIEVDGAPIHGMGISDLFESGKITIR